MDRALSATGVTPPQFSVLTMIVNYPGISGADLARLTMLTPPSVTVIVANLRKAEAVYALPHPVHGRIQQLFPTERGKVLLDDCGKRVAKLEDRLGANLTRGELSVVTRWLSEVARYEETPNKPPNGRNHNR